MSHSPGPAPEMNSALKRRIATLEEENAKLVNKMIKLPVHSYVREGRVIRRLVDLSDPITDLIAEYDRRVLLAEDEDEIEHVASSDKEGRTFRSYKKLLQWCPSITRLTQANVDGYELTLACQELKKGADGARGDDANTLKRSIPTWLNHQTPYPTPLLIVNDKQGRGFNHDLTGGLICPVDYNWLDAPIRDAIRTYHPNYPVTAYMWPSFLYANGQYNAERPSVGLFKGELLVRAFRCIFTSPSSAHEDEDEDAGGQPHASGRARRPSRLIRTRCDVAGLLKMRSVQPRAIAYIAVQLRFALSSSTSWDLNDDNFSYQTFYDNIVDWFECPRSRTKAQAIEELLLWWNRIIFGPRHASTLQPQDVANLSVAASME